MIPIQWPELVAQYPCARCCLTHWGRDKMAAISQTTFSNAFSWMKMYKFRLRFHWSLFPRVQLTIFQHWFRWWLGAVQATSHYLNQWWIFYWRIYASLGLNELTSVAMLAFHKYQASRFCEWFSICVNRNGFSQQSSVQIWPRDQISIQMSVIPDA